MSGTSFVDGVLAFRILQLLTTPFEEMDAYKLGLINDQGEQLKKPTTDAEKRAWTILTRVVVRVKRAVLRSSAGSLASIAAAYWLVKECYDKRVIYGLSMMTEEYEILLENADEYIPVEEMVLIQSILGEDAPTNNTTAIPGEHEPVITQAAARKYREFNVTSSTFNKFSKGKQKFSRWSQYIDTTNEEENDMYDYAKKNPRGIIILKHGDQTRAIRFNRRGGGNWHKIRRPTRITESTYSENPIEIEICCVNLSKL